MIEVSWYLPEGLPSPHAQLGPHVQLAPHAALPPPHVSESKITCVFNNGRKSLCFEAEIFAFNKMEENEMSIFL